MGVRWGLCCQFADGQVRFRQATHRYVASLEPSRRTQYLRDIARSNAIALAHAISRCRELDIGAFRISSQILPLATHPVSGYRLDALDEDGVIRQSFAAAGHVARSLGIRLSLHPDQFVVLNSTRDDVVTSSVRELDVQGYVAALVGADTITVHVGGMTDGKTAALDRLERNLDRLPDAARERLALENDDRLFAVRDLHPVCTRTSTPLVYDVHHHRCNPDGLDIESATSLAEETWRGREPWMHIASARDGRDAPNPRPHSNYIDAADFPPAWIARNITVDVEAKAKEAAIASLRDALGQPRVVAHKAPRSARKRLAH